MKTFDNELFARFLSHSEYAKELMKEQNVETWAGPVEPNVHCGSLPLVSHVGISAQVNGTFWRNQASAYVNTAGEFVFPA